MKALTLWRPWALFVCTGEKRIENRPWAPPDSMIGERIAIHAGLKIDAKAIPKIRDLTGVDVAAQIELGHHQTGIIGTAKIVGWWRAGPPPRLGRQLANIHVPSDLVRMNDRDLDWLVGPIGWVLREPVLFKAAIEVRGFQKLWNLSAEAERLVNLATERALR